VVVSTLTPRVLGFVDAKTPPLDSREQMTMSRLTDGLPQSVTRSVRAWAWTTWVVQVLIVVTGGAVRLTASGLGCPTWPKCTADSLVSTPEMGIHGVIEFGNRLLTFLLVIVAIATFLAVVRMRKQRRDLFVLALVIGLGIPAQAVIGGISVLMNLNPYVVGLHFVISAIMIVLSTMFVTRVYGLGFRSSVTVLSTLAWLVATLQALTVLAGILVTGSGPHAGDAKSPRNGLPSDLLQHIHSYPAYAALLLVVIVVIYSWRTGRRDVSRISIGLLAVNALQAGVGVTQSNLGLPVVLVGLHMLLACLVVSATTWLVITARRLKR